MTIRVWALNGKNLNYLDHDVMSSAYSLLNPWIIEGMNVVAGFVEVGRALIAVERRNITPHQKFLVHCEITTREAVDTNGTKKVWIEVNKNFIEDGTLAKNPNGTEIARVMTGTNYPNPANTFFIPLASIQGGRITDERKVIQKRITDVRRLNNPRLPKDYWTINSGGFSEVTEFNTAGNLGIRGSANNYHTVYTTAWHDNSVKTTQLTYSPGEIWTRSARDPDNWNDWQKVFPFSATALDISGLTEATEPALSDELLIRSGWANKKVTAENLRKWNMIPFWNNSINKGEKTFDSWGGNTESYAVPRWWIVTIGCHSRNGTYHNDGNYHIEHSTNNSSWSSLHNININSAHKTSTIIVPPGFVRLKGYRIDIHYSIQAFS